LAERVRGAGVVIGVRDDGAEVQTAPLAPSDLAALFEGPEVVLHLPSDAAAALHARTDGVAGRVVSEVDGWVGNGVAEWVGPRLRVDRVGLERVAAGLLPRRAIPATAKVDGALDELLGWIALAGEEATSVVLHRATGLPTWEIEAELAELAELGAVRGHPDGRIEATAASAVQARWSEQSLLAAHRALAEALPSGAQGRLLHLAAAGDDLALAREALVAGDRLAAQGAHTRATLVLGLGLGRVSGAEAPEVRDALVCALAHAALSAGEPGVLRAAALDLRRVEAPGARALDGLLTALALHVAGDVEGALRAAGLVPPLADPELDWARLLPGRTAALTRSPAEAADILGPEPTSPTVRRRWWEQHAVALALQGRYTEAGALHARVAADDPSPRRRAIAWYRAGSDLLDAGDPEAADGALQRALTIAETHRLAELEAYARLGRRRLEWRTRRGGVRDPELLEAVRRLGLTRVHAQALLVEATLAWRDGELGDVRTLAGAAASAYEAARVERGALLARALAIAGGAPAGDWAGLCDEARRIAPALHFQVVALLAAGGVAVPPGIARDAEAAARAAAGAPREWVLDPEEAAQYLRAVGGSS